VEHMLPQGRVFDEETKRVLETDDQIVSEFLRSDEVKGLKDDRELVKYFYKETGESRDDWIECYNKNNKRVRYKYEEGCSLVSC
jgi:hypothetical protein